MFLKAISATRLILNTAFVGFLANSLRKVFNTPEGEQELNEFYGPTLEGAPFIDRVMIYWKNSDTLTKVGLISFMYFASKKSIKKLF